MIRKNMEIVYTILLLPLTKTVTVRALAHSSMTSILSLVVPKETSRTMPAWPNFSGVRSSNRGTIRPFVAIAISYKQEKSIVRIADMFKVLWRHTSISGPPTHRTAGNSFCINKWFASSSNPHWQITKFAPVSFTLLIISSNFSFSYSLNFLYSSTLVISNLCFVFGRGGSNGQVRMASLALRTEWGIWGWDMSLSTRTPLMREVSAREPPTLPSTLMRSKGTSFRSRSATERTASTAISANFWCSFETLYMRNCQSFEMRLSQIITIKLK